MNQEPADWLYQEVHDLLDVSSVGLYEFLDLLRTPGHDVPPERRRDVATAVLKRLLAEPGTELRRLRWPDFDSLGSVDVIELDADSWNAPDDDGMYVAIDRPE